MLVLGWKVYGAWGRELLGGQLEKASTSLGLRRCSISPCSALCSSARLLVLEKRGEADGARAAPGK